MHCCTAGSLFKTQKRRGLPPGDFPTVASSLNNSQKPDARLLLDLDFGSCSLKLLLDLLSVFFGNAFFDRLRSGFNKILRIFQTETGDGTDFLDDVDLARAGIGENNIEFSLLFSSGSRSRTRSMRKMS